MDPATKRMLEQASRSMNKGACRCLPLRSAAATADLEEVVMICEQKGYRTSLTRKCIELLTLVSPPSSAAEQPLSQGH
jgi:hypothetical protein